MSGSSGRSGGGGGGRLPQTGDRVEVITNSQCRYQGQFLQVDRATATFTLSNVRAFGTEDRPASPMIAPSPKVYGNIRFNAGDVASFHIVPTPEPFVDPAIVTTARPNDLHHHTAAGGHHGGPSSAGLPVHHGGAVLQHHHHLGPAGDSAVVMHQLAAAPTASVNLRQDSCADSVAAAEQQHTNSMMMQQQPHASRGGGGPPPPGFHQSGHAAAPLRPLASSSHELQHFQFDQPVLPSDEFSLQDDLDNQNEQHQYRHQRHGAYPNHHHHRSSSAFLGPELRGASVGSKLAGGDGSFPQTHPGAVPQLPMEEFDFEQGIEEFNRLRLGDNNNNKEEAADADDDEAVDEHKDNLDSSAADLAVTYPYKLITANNGLKENKTTAAAPDNQQQQQQQPTTVAYDKEKSFFDNISGSFADFAGGNRGGGGNGFGGGGRQFGGGRGFNGGFNHRFRGGGFQRRPPTVNNPNIETFGEDVVKQLYESRRGLAGGGFGPHRGGGGGRGGPLRNFGGNKRFFHQQQQQQKDSRRHFDSTGSDFDDRHEFADDADNRRHDTFFHRRAGGYQPRQFADRFDGGGGRFN